MAALTCAGAAAAAAPPADAAIAGMAAGAAGISIVCHGLRFRLGRSGCGRRWRRGALRVLAIPAVADLRVDGCRALGSRRRRLRERIAERSFQIRDKRV